MHMDANTDIFIPKFFNVLNFVPINNPKLDKIHRRELLFHFRVTRVSDFQLKYIWRHFDFPEILKAITQSLTQLMKNTTVIISCTEFTCRLCRVQSVQLVFFLKQTLICYESLYSRIWFMYKAIFSLRNYIQITWMSYDVNQECQAKFSNFRVSAVKTFGLRIYFPRT
jgi:hypothetical protein